MSNVEDLYHEEVLHHATHPSNYGVVTAPSAVATGHNPLCGDMVTVSLEIENDIVKNIKFEGKGCGISQASASMMTEAIVGKTTNEAKTLFEEFHHAITAKEELVKSSLWDEKLKFLKPLKGVRKFPIRVKCATLAWHALHQALREMR